jgi:hypothetical protein
LGDYSAAADKSNPPRHAVAFTMDKAGSGEIECDDASIWQVPLAFE